MKNLQHFAFIGYYGRSTVITWEDCQSIEQVRASALNAKGYSVGIPRLQIYDAKERGGMGMEHAYTYAAAALIDQVDRALSAVEGEPARVAVESSLAHTLRRLFSFFLSFCVSGNFQGTTQPNHNPTQHETTQLKARFSSWALRVQ